MNDSSIDEEVTDGGLEVGPSADELFGGVESESFEGEPVERRPDDGTTTVPIEDRTAADVFDDLRTETSASGDVAELLADESPEDIIASADEPAEPTNEIDDDLTVDDETLGDLLLTDRTEGEEFLWVDAGDADDSVDEDTENDADRPRNGPAAESDVSAAATDDSSTASDSTRDGPIPLVPPESEGETDEDPARVASESDDDGTFRGGLVADAAESTARTGGDEGRDDATVPETNDRDDERHGPETVDRDDAETDERHDADADTSSDGAAAASGDDAVADLLARLRSLPLVGRLL